MNHPNQLLGAERQLGETTTASENTCSAAVGQSSGYRDRAPTISTTIEVRATDGFDVALQQVIYGARITRAGWNARGQYVEAQLPDKHSRMTAPYLVLRNAQGDLVPWVPSQGDLFARDWAVLPR